MDPSNLVSVLQPAGGDVMIWVIFPNIPLVGITYLSIVADHIHLFMTPVCPSVRLCDAIVSIWTKDSSTLFNPYHEELKQIW